ncbi:MAG: radical SAM protein [archaeon]
MHKDIDKNELPELKVSFQKSEPFKLEILKFKLTNSCNSHCDFCDYWTQKDISFFDYETFCKLITSAKKLGLKKVILSGGEPLLHPQIIQILNFLEKKEINTTIITNGLLFQNKYKDLLAQIKNMKLTFVFSLDGAIANTHDTIRGVKGNFDKIIKAIDTLNKNKKRNQIRICISTTLSEKNYQELEDILLIKNTHNYDSISFTTIRSKVGGKNFEPNTKWLSKLINQKNKVITLAKKLELPVESIERGFENGIINEKKCFLPYFQLEIDIDGKAYPCCLALENQTNQIGSTFSTPLNEIWFGKQATAFRLSCLHINYSFCKNCIYTYQNRSMATKLKL